MQAGERPTWMGKEMRTKAKSAAEQAVQRWGELALHVRGEMRSCGVRGPLPQIDRYVSTTRGGGYARFLADFVSHVRNASRDAVTAEVVARELRALAEDVVAAVYAEPPKAA